MLVEGLTAIQDWAPVAALRSSRWTYASVNTAHIVGFAILFGSILPMDLRLMGWRRAIPIGTFARVLVPVSIAGLVLAITAGALLFSIRAVEYAETTLFQVKMALVVCAIGNAVLLRRAAQWEAQQTAANVMPPLRLQLAGALSLVLWLSVIVCGRMIAFLD
ncbi:MAG: hypothetical protein GEU91_14470 [Rhizobiales bacterium]|nr:hypothetical protein [Hyphomicrobiales bacterium]